MKKILQPFFLLIMMLFECTSKKADSYVSQENADFAATLVNLGLKPVDVRTAAEYAAGHLPQAILIDVNGAHFADSVLKLLPKEKPVALYCRSGSRSKRAASQLVALGYKVYELNRGIIHWDGEVVGPED